MVISCKLTKEKIRQRTIVDWFQIADTFILLTKIAQKQSLWCISALEGLYRMDLAKIVIPQKYASLAASLQFPEENRFTFDIYTLLVTKPKNNLLDGKFKEMRQTLDILPEQRDERCLAIMSAAFTAARTLKRGYHST